MYIDKSILYRGYMCLNDRNNTTGIIYSNVVDRSSKSILEFNSSSPELALSTFQEAIDELMGIKTNAKNTKDFELHFTITGLPHPLEGTYNLPTANDVLWLYLKPDRKVEALEEAISRVGSLSISYDMNRLWVSLPEWLQAAITTMLQVSMQIGELDLMYECDYIAMLVASLTLKPPEQPGPPR